MKLLGRPGRDLPLLVVVSVAAAIVLDWSMKHNAVSAPEPLADKHDPPAVKRASANLPALFSTDDYPQAALRRDEQGTVAFALAINDRGRVERCYIAESSGSATLDEATCSILAKRARFIPGRSADGETVADITNGRIRWQLPED